MSPAEAPDASRERVRGEMSRGRVDALSDGVFAVALTLLTFDVVAAAKASDETGGLADHLLGRWPTLLAFFVGFATILVCWINHHCVYGYVRQADAGLLWVNGYQLALVSLVPFPTAVLAEHVTGNAGDRRTALLLYGLLFFLIASSFWGLWHYVVARGLADLSIDPVRAQGMGFNYGCSAAWTVLCLFVAAVSVVPALVMWALMFVVFAVPASFARFTGSRLRSRSVRGTT